MKFKTVKFTAAQSFYVEFEAGSILEALEKAPAIAHFGFRRNQGTQNYLDLRRETETGWEDVARLGAVVHTGEGWFYKDFDHWRNPVTSKRIPMDEEKLAARITNQANR